MKAGMLASKSKSGGEENVYLSSSERVTGSRLGLVEVGCSVLLALSSGDISLDACLCLEVVRSTARLFRCSVRLLLRHRSHQQSNSIRSNPYAAYLGTSSKTLSARDTGIDVRLGFRNASFDVRLSLSDQGVDIGLCFSYASVDVGLCGVDSLSGVSASGIDESATVSLGVGGGFMCRRGEVIGSLL